ncbi:MAG: Crp/Fnr family transcriptional regulator [Bacteroidota bacterium]
MEVLRAVIAKMITISAAELDAFVAQCYRKTFKKKDFLSDAERFVHEIYFIEEGLLRVMITDVEGREHTTHFAVEQQFIADYNAFLTGQRSKYQLQALEDSSTIVLPRKAIEWGYEHLQEGEKLGRLIAEYYFIYLDTRLQHQYTLSPKERYDLMNDIFPDIHNRVPQHMIASYLGITAVHLSRIKRQ